MPSYNVAQTTTEEAQGILWVCGGSACLVTYSTSQMNVSLYNNFLYLCFRLLVKTGSM